MPKKELYLLLFVFISACDGPANTLFTKLDTSETGVDFQNNLTETEAFNAFTFTNFYNGGGVGIGDFNNDGLKDFILTKNQGNPGLFINKGQLKFIDVSTTSGISNDGWATGVSIVDINQDGWDDIYLSRASHETIRNSKNLLFINQQTEVPTFIEKAEEYGLAFPGFTTQTVFFDYDVDGDLDAFLLNTAPDIANPNYLRPRINDGTYPSTDQLFENKGIINGQYQYENVSQKAGITYEGLGLGVAVSDYNGDGLLDLYCSNDFLSSDLLYLNMDDGTFNNIISEVINHTSMYGMGIDVADFNNDAKVDIFQLDMLPEGNKRQKQMIASSDYDKKKLSTSVRYGYMPQYMRNTLQLNLGTINSLPKFAEVGLLFDVAKTDWSWSVLLADYDQDGFKDVFITNGYRKNVTDLDFVKFNKQNNFFGTDESRETKRQELLAAVPEIKLKNYAFKNSGGQSFENVSKAWGLDELSYANGAATADLDNDGDLDLIVNNIDEPTSIFKNNLNPEKSIKLSLKGNEGNLKGIGAKVKVWGEGKEQFFEIQSTRGYLSSMPVELNLSGEIDSIEVKWPNGKSEIKRFMKYKSRTTFYEKDAKKLLRSSKKSIKQLFKQLEQLENIKHTSSAYVDFNATPALHKMQSKVGPKLTQADLNNDGWKDIIVPGGYGGSPTYLLYFNNGSIIKKDSISTPMNVGKVLTLDLENDGTLELLFVPTESERPLQAEGAYQPLLYQQKKGRFLLSQGLIPDLKTCSQAALVYDFDKDGDDDVVIAGHHKPKAYPLTMPSYLLENDAGVLRVIQHPISDLLSAEGLISSIEIIPSDAGELEIAYSSNWASPKILSNKEGNWQSKAILPNTQGWWNCILPADLDGDGDVDFVLGNEGNNTVLKASEEKPVSLLAKDFNGDGKVDPLMSYYLENREVPLAPLVTMTQQVIQFRKGFKLFADYAESDFNDVKDLLNLTDATILQATYLSSCIAINNGNGTYTKHQLPTMAQAAPIQDIIVYDFTKDGIKDLLIVGGFYPNESNMGPQDALHGLLLVGDESEGVYHAQLPTTSGFYTDGDVRSLIYLEDQNLVVSGVQDGKLIFHAIR